MDIFLAKYGAPVLKAIRCLALLMMCAVVWSCNSSPEELDKEELALYNDTVEQLAWQWVAACSHPAGANAIVWSSQHADSAKNMMRAQAEKRVLYYQPKISATRKAPQLSDWLTVEISSWDRYFSTFSGTTPKQVMASLTVSSALETGKLRVDYMNIVNLDTASNTPIDSSASVVRLSKPYYNKDRNRAMLYFESGCGAKRARGELLMLRYKENKWVIEERRKVWVK